MKKLHPQQVEGMTIFGVGLAIGVFGLSILEKASISLFPKTSYIMGGILVVLGLYYLYISIQHSRAKE